LFVSVIALVFAVGGVATALPGKKTIDKNDLKKNVVKSEHIKDGNVKYQDTAPGIAVRAYAKITGDGQVNEALSRGITDANIDEFGGGFCIENLPFKPRHIQATHGYLSGGDNELRADIPAPSFGAPEPCSGNDAWVYLGDDGPDIYVALYE
jgi:hypothetical protein